MCGEIFTSAYTFGELYTLPITEHNFKLSQMSI